MRISRAFDGLVLLAFYRIALKAGMYTADEFQSILGDAALSYIAPVFTVLSVIIFGYSARLYFKYRP